MSAPSAKQRAHARDAFEEGAIALFRKAVSQRFGFRMAVDARGGDGLAELLDDDGRVMSSCRLAGVQLALPLAPSTEASAPAAAVSPAVPEALAPSVEAAPVEATEASAPIVVPPIAPPGRTLRPGDLVFAGARGMWLVLRIEDDDVVLVDAHYHEKVIASPGEVRVPREAIDLNAADLWFLDNVFLSAPIADRDEGVSEVSDGHSAGVPETPEMPVDKPAESLWVLFSVEVDDRHDDPIAWAEKHGLRWCLGGVLVWSIEGGGSRRGVHRMVTIIARKDAVELLDLCNEAKLSPTLVDVDYGAYVLRVGATLCDEGGRVSPWTVTAIDRATGRVEYSRDGTIRSCSVHEIDSAYDGTGEFALVQPRVAAKASELRKPPAAKPKPSKALKAIPAKVVAGYVELRVPTAVFAKHRKGLLDLAKQPLGGLWKVSGDTASAVVSTGSLSVRRVLSYCNRNNIKLAIEGASIDVVNAMGPSPEAEESPAAAPPALPTSGALTDDGFELFASRQHRWWMGHAKKGRYGLLRHWIDGRVELLATAATEAEVRKHNRSDLMAPGVTEVIVVGRDGGTLGSSSRGHAAFEVPGRWTAVASSERGYLRWQGDDEAEARAAFERLCAVPDCIVAVLTGPDGKKCETGDGRRARAELAEDEALDAAAQTHLSRATREQLRVDQLVRVASGSAGINGVPVSLAGESVVVVKIGPKLVKVHSHALGRSYAVPVDALELLDGGAS